MSDLLTLTREFDLPPKWDGHPVEWGEWDKTPVIICPTPQRDPCDGCGSTAGTLTNHGTMLVKIAQGNVVQIGHSRLHEHQKRALLAHRCPDCLLDKVWDTWADEWWDLDHTDYGPEGSNPPENREGEQ